MPKTSAAVSPPATPAAAGGAVPVSYEAAVQELDTLIATLESGAVPLEELLVGYQRGAFLLEFCREKLQAVEAQIKVLDDGVLKPWKAA